MKVEDRTNTKFVSRPPAWEYRHTTADLDADLTQFGQDGWELVSVVPIPHDPTQAVYHFKRRRVS